MKNNLNLCVAAIAICAIFVGCNNSDYDGNLLTADIDSDCWRAPFESVNGYLVTTGEQTSIKIEGADNNGKSLTLFVENYTGPSSYPLDMPKNKGLLLPIPTATSPYIAQNGSINIASDANNILIGSFNFTGKDAEGKLIVVESGEFEVLLD